MTQSVGRPGQHLPSRSSGGFGSFTHTPGHAVLGYEADPSSPPTTTSCPVHPVLFPSAFAYAALSAKENLPNPVSWANSSFTKDPPQARMPTDV